MGLSQDIIYLTDKSEIESKIIEITSTTIKYKKANQLDGPTRNVDISDIFMIIYEDGSREIFSNENVTKKQQIEKKEYISLSSSDLRGQKEFGVQFDYSNTEIEGYKNEQDYIIWKVNYLNSKSPGKGDEWLRLWQEDKNDFFQPAFIEVFQKGTNLKLDQNNDNPFTIVVYISMIELGRYNGFSDKRGSINAIIQIVQTNSPNNIVDEVFLKNCRKRHAYTIRERVTNAYWECGTKYAEYFNPKFR